MDRQAFILARPLSVTGLDRAAGERAFDRSPQSFSYIAHCGYP
jgi:hypothetical protein